MCVYVCLLVVFCHHVHLDPEISYVFTATPKKTFIIVIFAKRSFGVIKICLPRMPPTTLNPKRRIPKESAEGWKAIDSPDSKNASFRSYCTFAYLLRAHIPNINMRRYITSACGHAVGAFAHMLTIIMPGLNSRWLQSELLIEQLSE